MITGCLAVVCAIFGLVSGSYTEYKAPQEYYSPQVSVPVQSDSSYSVPTVVSDNIFSSGVSGYSSSPVVSNNVFSSGSSSYSPAYTSLVSSPISENVYSSGASASIPVTLTQQSSPVALAEQSVPVTLSQQSVPVTLSQQSVPVTLSQQSVPVTLTQQTVPTVQASGNSVSELLSSGSSTSPVSELISSGSSESSYGTPVVATSSQQTPSAVSQRYICTKTIVRPEIYQRTIIVPTIQRYLRRTVTPVIENIAYRTTPVAQESSSSGSDSYLSSYGRGSYGQRLN